MRVLLYFADMVGMNFLKLHQFNPAPYSLERYLPQLGGTLFTNCHTSCPDTPRSLATIFTGRVSDENGCNRRDLWPGYNLTSSASSFFQTANESGFRTKALVSETESKSCRLLSRRDFEHIDTHNTLSSLIDDLRSESCADQLIFIQDNDCHFSISDYGGTRHGHTLGASRVAENLRKFFKFHEPDYFDLVIIFSDHGFRPRSIFGTRSPLGATYPGKSNVLLHIRSRGDTEFSVSDGMHSTAQLGSLVHSVLSSKTVDKGVLNFKNQTLNLPFIIEDYSRNDTSPGGFPDLWTVLFPEFVYRESSTGTVEIDFLHDVQADDLSKESATVLARDYLLMSSQSYRYSSQLNLNGGLSYPPIATYLDGSLRKQRRFHTFKLLSRTLHLLQHG